MTVSRKDLKNYMKEKKIVMNNKEIRINYQKLYTSDLTFDKKYNIGSSDIATILIKYCDLFGNIKTYAHYLGSDGHDFQTHIVAKKEDVSTRYHHVYTIKSKWLNFVDDEGLQLKISCDEAPIEINLFRCGKCGLCIYLNYDSPLPVIAERIFDSSEFDKEFTKFISWFPLEFGQEIEISLEFDFLEQWFSYTRPACGLKFYIDSIEYVKKLYISKNILDLFYLHFNKFCELFNTEQYLSIVPFFKKEEGAK